MSCYRRGISALHPVRALLTCNPVTVVERVAAVLASASVRYPHPPEYVLRRVGLFTGRLRLLIPDAVVVPWM